MSLEESTASTLSSEVTTGETSSSCSSSAGDEQQKPQRTTATKCGDEQLGGLSLTISVDNNMELTDPAILVVREVTTKFRYTREELLNLREVPLSKRKPDFLNEIAPSIFDSTRTNYDRKKSDATSENGTRTGDSGDHRRRSGDPRERIRKENDGIVLSPQRRSFNSGCFVPVRDTSATNRANRAHSPLGGKNETAHIGVREIPTGGSRRIGSGRILRDTWDFGDKTDNSNDTDYGFSRNHQQNRSNNTNNSVGTDERRNTYGRDFTTNNNSNNNTNNNEKDKERRNNNNRYNNNNERRRITTNEHHSHHHHHRDEEPEWFSGGPSSQNDTIELRGFDDNEKIGNNKKITQSKSSSTTTSNVTSKKGGKEWSTTNKKGKDEQITNSKTSTNTTTTIINSKLKKNIDKKEVLHLNDGNDHNKRSTPTTQDVINVELKLNCDNKEKKEQTHNSNNTNTLKNENGSTINDQNSFNFEDIFNIPGLPGLLSNGDDESDSENRKSRFTKWFQNSTAANNDNPNKNETSHSSLQADALMKNIMKNISEAADLLLTNDDKFFEPISPAAKTRIYNNIASLSPPSSSTTTTTTTNSVNNFFNNSSNLSQTQSSVNNSGNKNSLPPPPPSGRLLILSDIEANMFQKNDGTIPTTSTTGVTTTKTTTNNNKTKNDDDMTAFNRLLANFSAINHSTGQMNAQSMSLMEMLNHSQQQDEARMASAHTMGHASPHLHMQQQKHQQQTTVNDLTTRMQQQQHQHQQQSHKQVEMFSKLMHSSGIHMRTSPLHDMSRELLNRPEAQAILQGMKRGDITPQHLYQQLANPALQPRHREMLLIILKFYGNGQLFNNNSGSGGGGNGGIGPSPRVLSPIPPNQLYQQQHQAQQQQQIQQQAQQQLRISPLPPNALHQRIPSPRELQVHTQNILQRALIKKKLEEQQENYRKKQEIQQGDGQSPINLGNNNTQPQQQPISVSATTSLSSSTSSATTNKNSNMSSPTPLAFTPTSVLRKMTAEKDEGAKHVDHSNKLNSGRPLSGIRPSQQQQQQPSIVGQWPFSVNMKQPGRPIVKANNFQQPEHVYTQLAHVQRLYREQQQQQQQQRKDLLGNRQQQIPQNQQFGQNLSGHLNQQQQYSNTNQFNQLTQQQLRAQHQQHARPIGQPQQQQQQQQINNFGIQGGNWQQFLSPHHQNNRLMGRNGGLNDGDLSPTTNQLTRWFSPDLLERARGGELPSTAGLSQHVLSLEEIERQTAPPVHN